jgi:hypothetical protein
MPEANLPKPSSNNEYKVTLHIEYGPVSTMQRQAWRRLWLKLLADAKEKEQENKS